MCAPATHVHAQGFVRGLGQSRILEEANKILRDAASRHNASKVVKMLSMWELPHQGELLKQYGRNEVVATSQAEHPASEKMEK